MVYRVDLEEDRNVYFSGFSHVRTEREADFLIELWDRVGPFELIWEKDAIPAEVAAATNPELAAYLYSIHKMTKGVIAETIGVQESTIHQYLSDFGRGRR